MSKAVNLGTLADDISVSNGSVSLATSEIILPKHSTDPSNPVEGQFYYNTTTKSIKQYDGTTWKSLINSLYSTTGGVITEAGGYRYHTFNSSSVFNIVGDSNLNIEYLLVAGGGAGGSSAVSLGGGGGGGAGGMLTGSVLLSPGSYTIIIGAGGVGNNSNYGGNGENSEFLGHLQLTAIGGGGGGYGGNNPSSSTGRNGGSGGGGGYRGYATENNYGSGTSGQGNRGGGVQGGSASGGGGGGKGGVGLSNTGSGGGTGGLGGPGELWLDGNTYAVGGQGGEASNENNVNAPANTGNGGAGTYSAANGNVAYNGGSGICIIRYPI